MTELPPFRRPSFRVAGWYALLTGPFRIVATPLWGRVYRHVMQVRLLKELPVQSWKRGNIAYILGSGPSINDLTENQWREMRRGTTVGFNWWLYHPHVPDLYVFENLTERHRSALMHRAPDYAETPLILKQFLTNFSPRKHRARLRSLSELPLEVRQNIFMSSDLVVPGRTRDELERWFRRAMRVRWLCEADRIQWLPKRAASLTFLVALCARAGFRDVVLCGVDLNTPGSFYDPAPLGVTTERSAREASNRTIWVHETENPSEKVLPISAVLQALNETVLEPRGIRLHVAHSASALARTLPVYEWERA
jgi:hypothetical protein